ncbi:hypothetical protein LPJ59_000012 [Coemansia sp. RSA 2399]|nr:hypothetical protein LPJ59_000012 [Coemansia sp. RSA 2399]
MTAVTTPSDEQQQQTAFVANTTISSAQPFPSTIFQHFPTIGGSLGLSGTTSNDQNSGVAHLGHLGNPSVHTAVEVSSGLEPRDSWFQSLISQSSQHPGSSVSGIESNKSDDSSRPLGMPRLTDCRAMSSDSESDDISKSLSFLLAQQLGQQQQQQQNLHGDGVHNAKQSNIGLFAAAASPYYSAALTDMLEIGYDGNGSRRVISMPNPLGNLSFEIPINPPVHLDHPAAIGMSQPCNLMPSASCSIDDVDKFLTFQGSSALAASGMQASALGITESADKCTAANKKRKTKRPKLAGSGSCKSSPDICGGVDHAPLDFPPPLPFMNPALASRKSTHQAPVLPSDGNNQKVPRNDGTADNTSPPTKWPIIDHASNNSSRISTPLLLGSATTPGTPSTPSATAMSATAMSALLSHRVDRQMAASGARPLLFVRPRSKDGPARRRKRRCVSANNAPEPEQPLQSSMHEPSTPAAEISMDMAAHGEQHTLQWQRISEQRRRDAMRENFDLLKRMLPQAYMDSDDGRELARPVLLARFLRWVDDTLIEMETLKTEVAQLRSQVHFLTADSKSTASSANAVWQSAQQQLTQASSVMSYYPVSF